MPAGVAAADPSEPSDRVESLVAAMSLEEKVGQLFMVSFYGDEAMEAGAAPVRKNRSRHGVANAAELVSRYHVGGVIYFNWAGNLPSPKQVARLSNGIQNAALATPTGIPLLISADQEGGSVTRLKPPATQFAGNMALGATRRTDLARSAARVMGEELRAVGINEVLAPVADVNVNASNPVIGIRSFGSEPSMVADMTAAQVLGFQSDGGVAATVKHFPGHGDTNVDSHSGLPVIDHTRSEWEQLDAPPFQAAIEAGVDVIMTGHIAVPALDPSGRPATLSGPILQDLLREDLGFEGVVMTDSLGMGALRRTFSDERIPVLAILAGADILLNPPSLPVAFNAVLNAVLNTEITEARLDASVTRILKLKEDLGLFESATIRVRAVRRIVGSTQHRTVENAVARASVTLVANDGEALPLTTTGNASFLLVGSVGPPLDTLAAALGERGLASEKNLSGPHPAPASVSLAVARAAAHDYVLVLTHNADTDVEQRALVDALSTTGTPVITVSIGRPYDIAYYDAAAHLCLYSRSNASMRALVAVLLGEMAPTGRLPVAIPVANDPDLLLFEYGFGLSYP